MENLNVGPEFEVIEDKKAPKGRRIVRKDGAAPAKTEKEDDVDATDQELRDYIQDRTGDMPHHKTGRAKLVAQYLELQEEE